jgi:uncharacterized protein (TIRG00374 family)
MRWRTVGKWILALGLLAVVFFLGDVRELLHLHVAWIFVFGMFLSTFAFILLHTLRWKKIVDAISGKKGENLFSFYKWVIHSYVLGYIMPIDVSLIGVRTYYLTQYKHLSLPASLFSVTLDRLLDVLIFFVVLIPSIFYIRRILPSSEAMILMGIWVGGFFFVTRWKEAQTFWFLTHLYRKILDLPIIRSRMRGKGNEVRWEYPFKRGGFSALLAWSAAKYLLLVLRFYFTGMALNVNLSFLQSLFVIPVIQCSALISITPGSLGVLELGSWGALFLIAVPKDQILRFVLGQRVLLTFVLLLLILFNHLFFLLKNRWQGMDQKDIFSHFKK